MSFSEDSDFFGSEDLIQELEEDSSTTDAAAYWAAHGRYPAVQSHAARQKLAIARQKEAQKPKHNPFEGQTHKARQLSETPLEFSKRLPPSTTIVPDAESWLWVADPAARHKFLDKDHAGLLSEGEALLQGFLAFKQKTEERAQASGTMSTLWKQLRPRETRLAEEIKQVAVKHGVVTGKWMLFPTIESVNESWRHVCEGVVNGKLGPIAKVQAATKDKEKDSKTGAQRLVCIYTRDFADEQDVRRVLDGLCDLGLVRKSDDRPIYYKLDAYTHLGIEGKNEYGLRNSAFSSNDFLKKGK